MIEQSPRHPSFSEHLVAIGYFRRREAMGPGPVMIDVGAFDGGSSEPFLAAGWTVHLVEPDPRLRASLASKVREYEAAYLHSYALADRAKGEAPFYTSLDVPSISSLKPFDPSHEETCRVEVRTLRQLIQVEGIEWIDYLKIDAEGFDLPILWGFPWERLTPELVICEFEDAKTSPLGYGWRDLGDYLVAQGYSVYLSEWYPLEEYGGRHDWRAVRRYPCELESPDAWGNFIAVAPSRSALLEEALREVILADRTKQHLDVVRLTEALQQVRNDLREKNRRIQELRQELERRQQALTRSREAVKSRDVMIARLRQAVENRDRAIGQLRGGSGKD